MSTLVFTDVWDKEQQVPLRRERIVMKGCQHWVECYPEDRRMMPRRVHEGGVYNMSNNDHEGNNARIEE